MPKELVFFRCNAGFNRVSKKIGDWGGLSVDLFDWVFLGVFKTWVVQAFRPVLERSYDVCVTDSQVLNFVLIWTSLRTMKTLLICLLDETRRQ